MRNNVPLYAYTVFDDWPLYIYTVYVL